MSVIQGEGEYRYEISNDWAKVPAGMTYAAFFPILLGTVAGVRQVDRRLIDAARTMAIPRGTIVSHVVVPAALPSLMVALRLGVASAWTAVVAAELIGAPSGVGYAVEWYRELLMTPQVMMKLAHKDCRLALKMVDGLGVAAPVGHAAFASLEEGLRRGLSDDDVGALLKLREEPVGVKVRLAAQ